MVTVSLSLSLETTLPKTKIGICEKRSRVSRVSRVSRERERAAGVPLVFEAGSCPIGTIDTALKFLAPLECVRASVGRNQTEARHHSPNPREFQRGRGQSRDPSCVVAVRGPLKRIRAAELEQHSQSTKGDDLGGKGAFSRLCGEFLGFGQHTGSSPDTLGSSLTRVFPLVFPRVFFQLILFFDKNETTRGASTNASLCSKDRDDGRCVLEHASKDGLCAGALNRRPRRACARDTKSQKSAICIFCFQKRGNSLSRARRARPRNR